MGAPIDLASARATFDASTDGTVGLEEEFAILDPGTLDLVPRFEELRDAAAAEDPALHAQITGELISSEIEIVSGRGADVHDAIARQRDVRRRLFLLARSRGVALGATAGRALFGRVVRIGAERGQVQSGAIPDSSALSLLTAHPSAVLRMRDTPEYDANFDLLVTDLRTAAAAAA